MKPAHMSFDAGRTWIDLLVAAELSHVDVADLCHGLVRVSGGTTIG